MSLEKFISLTKSKGVSRDNRFECSGTALDSNWKIALMVQTVSLPGIQFHTGLYKNVGFAKKYINNVFYSDLSITFIDTADQYVRKWYDRWIDIIYTEENGGSIAYKDTYAKELQVIKKDRKGNTVDAYNFHKIYPINISDIALNTAGQNTASQLTVTFSYDNWTK